MTVMEFDVRYGTYTFKHEITDCPEMTPASFPDHYHACYELLYFIQGDADFMIQQNRYSLNPHSLLVIRPGEHHQVVLKSTSLYERIVIRFEESALQNILRRRMNTLDHVYSIAGTELSEELLRLDTLHERMQEAYVFPAFAAQLNVIIAALMSSSGLVRRADEVNESFRSIIRYIDTNLTNINTIDDLCTRLHLSRSAVQKIFTRQLHTPIMSYIRVQKIMLAHRLLAEGTSAAETAIHCGFRDYSSFYRAYTKIYGHTPTEDSRSLQNNTPQ